MKGVKALFIVFAALFLAGWVAALSGHFFGVALVFLSGLIIGLTILLFAGRIIQLTEEQGKPGRIWAERFSKRYGIPNMYPINTPLRRIRLFTWLLRVAGLVFFVGSAFVLFGLLIAAIKSG